MKNLKIKVFSWLLYQANSIPDKYFYEVKNKLLTKYGKHIQYDIQFIEGKKCYSCKGTGIYVKYNSYDGWYKETCWNCYEGWYKRPRWNVLALLQFGKFRFHKPFDFTYVKPENVNIIEGYIRHEKKKHSEFAKFVLLLMFEKGFLKRWYKNTGIGWRAYWWQPRNIVPNVIHIIKHGRHSYCFKRKEKPIIYDWSDDSLPF